MAAPFQWSLAALETLMAEDQMDQHAAVLRAFSVVELWRLRRVCRAFHRWGTAALAALPRVATVGGSDTDREATAGVEVLDLSTLRWSSGVVPALPEPRDQDALASVAKDGPGRVVVAGGDRLATGQTAAQWVRGAANWAPLPELAHGLLKLKLRRERGLEIGAFSGEQAGECLPISGDTQAVAIPAERLTDGGNHTDGSGTIAIAPTPGRATPRSTQRFKRPTGVNALHHLRRRQHLVQRPLVAVAHIHVFDQTQLHPLLPRQSGQRQQLIVIDPPLNLSLIHI